MFFLQQLALTLTALLALSVVLVGASPAPLLKKLAKLFKKGGGLGGGFHHPVPPPLFHPPVYGHGFGYGHHFGYGGFGR